MCQEDLGCNSGPGRKNGSIGFRSTGILWGINSRLQLRIRIRLGSVWNDKQTDRQTNIIVLPPVFDGNDPSANAAGDVG